MVLSLELVQGTRVSEASVRACGLGVSWAALRDGALKELQGNVAWVGKELGCGDMQPPLARVQFLLDMDDLEGLRGGEGAAVRGIATPPV